jgi:alpha-glucosidase
LLSDVPFFDRDKVHEIYRKWRKVFNSYSGERMSVAEAWVHPSSRATRYVRSDELHQIFNFDFLLAEWNVNFVREAIDKTIHEVSNVLAPPTWVLCNHDSPRLVSRLGGGTIGEAKARAMALITQALPGSIYIYQGEELGLENVDLADEARQDPVFLRTHGADKGRDGARVPLPWQSKGESYGFSMGIPWLPMPKNWSDRSVAVQEDDEDSFLNLYKKSLEIRKKHRALQPDERRDVSTSLKWLSLGSEILAFSRGFEFLLLANFRDQPCDLKVSGEILLASQLGVTLKDGSITLPAHTTCWINTST